jgi:hypothetical protein
MTTAEREAVEALIEHGTQERAAEVMGWKRSKLQSRLRRVQARALTGAAAAEPPPPVHGSVTARPVVDLATGTGVRRYILTAAQNNTPVHADFLTNLEAYAAAIGARIMVARFSYNKSAYADAKSKKPGTGRASDTEGLWYDPALDAYVCDDPERHGSARYKLAPDLLWCAEMNILPTAVRPLSGLESYAGSCSGIFPHAKIALESVPVIGDRPPKFNYTTGAVTQRNYIAKKEGLKGDFHHAYGALLVEVDLTTGDWWCRQLNATDDGSFYDLTFRVQDGVVSRGHALLAINWGDVHASEIDPDVAELNWKPAGVLDTLRPRYQFWHDTFSMRSRSHHEAKSFEKRFEKWVQGARVDSVEDEVRQTTALIARAHRPWCERVVVSSNHDRHIERWLDEADYKQDLPNAEFFLEAQLARAKCIRRGGVFNAFKWGVQRQSWDTAINCRFLERDESFLIGPAGHEIECGSHGDEGADGSRGNPANLSKMAVRGNYGHIHRTWLQNGGAWAGVCNRRLPYAHGPSSWSISDIGTYENGKRVILTMRNGKKWL